MSTPHEQRQNTRIQPFVVRCRVLVDGRGFSAYVTDLSPAGAQVRCEREPPAAGTRLVLDIALGRGQARSRMPGEVKWSRAPQAGGEQYVFGVGFNGLTDAERAVLEAALAEFQRRVALLS
jgi:PilZ domain